MDRWIDRIFGPNFEIWSLIILLLVLIAYVIYLIATWIRIKAQKHRLEDYACFVVRTYDINNIPRLIMRYYLREIESYNKLRQKPLFQRLYKELDADNTLLFFRKKLFRNKM